jgi:hypothetical protein
MHVAQSVDESTGHAGLPTLRLLRDRWARTPSAGLARVTAERGGPLVPNWFQRTRTEDDALLSPHWLSSGSRGVTSDCGELRRRRPGLRINCSALSWAGVSSSAQLVAAVHDHLVDRARVRPREGSELGRRGSPGGFRFLALPVRGNAGPLPSPPVRLSVSNLAEQVRDLLTVGSVANRATCSLTRHTSTRASAATKRLRSFEG